MFLIHNQMRTVSVRSGLQLTASCIVGQWTISSPEPTAVTLVLHELWVLRNNTNEKYSRMNF